MAGKWKEVEINFILIEQKLTVIIFCKILIEMGKWGRGVIE